MKALKLFGSLLFIVLALAWLHRSMSSAPLDDETMPPYGIGQVLAEQAAKAMGDKGRVALVCMSMNSIGGRAELAGFQETLARHNHIKLAITNLFKSSETAIGQLSFKQFSAVVNDDADVDVIVFLLGVGSFTDAEIATLPPKCPAFVVMDWNPVFVQRGMKAGIVKAAVMSRRLTALPSDHPNTPHQWFDRYYDLVTPDSIGASQ
jgi:hypothetical protein